MITQSLRNGIAYIAILSTLVSLQAKEQDYTNSSYTSLRKVCTRTSAWVLEARIDLYECNEEYIRDTKKIDDFLGKMCVLLRIPDWNDARMITCDGSLIPSSSGCTFVQLSGGAFIMGRVINETNSVQLTISANSYYDAQELTQFVKKFFGATNAELRVTLRK